MNKKVITSLVATGLLGVVALSAVCAPRIGNHILGNATQSTITTQTDILAAEQESAKEPFYEVQALDAYFDAHISETAYQEMIAFLKEIAFQKMAGNTAIEINKESFQFLGTDGVWYDINLPTMDSAPEELMGITPDVQTVWDTLEDRYVILEEQYIYDALRPEQPMPMLESADDMLYFNTQDAWVVVPTRALTDEEMLQLIDFRQRWEYVHRKYNTHAQIEAILADDTMMHLDDAQACVSQWMTALYDKILSTQSVFTRYNLSGEPYLVYSASTMRPQAAKLRGETVSYYMFQFHTETKALMSFRRDVSAELPGKTIETAEAYAQALQDMQAKDKVTQYMGVLLPEETITSITAWYQPQELEYPVQSFRVLVETETHGVYDCYISANDGLLDVLELHEEKRLPFGDGVVEHEL